MSTPRRYKDVAYVAERYSLSEWSVYDRARRRTLPFRKHPDSNRLYFLEADLDAFDDGAALEVLKLARGGVVVRPRKAVNGA